MSTTPKTTAGGDFPERERETSITAHVVRMGTVTMSFGDMETMYGIAKRAMETEFVFGYDVTVLHEFCEAIETIR